MWDDDGEIDIVSEVTGASGQEHASDDQDKLGDSGKIDMILETVAFLKNKASLS